MMTTDIAALLPLLAEKAGPDRTPLGEFTRRVAAAGTLDAADEAILARLTREIDVRKRLRAAYTPDFARAESDLPAPSEDADLLAGIFLLSAVLAQARGDRALALKRMNTGLKIAERAGKGDAGPGRALLAALDRMAPEPAP